MKHLIKQAAGRIGLSTETPGSAQRWDSFVFPQHVGDAVEKRLHQIPSQTSPAERRLLYQFFSQLWTGQHDVIEIGPFLGGTSRAIALGMLHNPRRDAGRLFTFDRFRDYFDVERLSEYLQPLVDAAELSQSQIDGLGARAPFIEIFQSIHGGCDYSECLVPSDHGVPDLPEQVSQGPWMTLPDGFQTDAVFIDGCKSWFGTRYFMQLISSAVRPGATLLFQDYGWYTCFWLAAFTEIFEDVFVLLGHVDNTYVFTQTRCLTSEEIEEGFPETPLELGEARLRELFESLTEKAIRRNDGFARVRHIMHHAAAMAVIDRRERARELLGQAGQLPEAASHRSVLKKALHSPTYTPHGQVLLD